jgi:hypothetical protein
VAVRVASACFPYWSCHATASVASDPSASEVSNDVHMVPICLGCDMSAVLRLVALGAFLDIALLMSRIAFRLARMKLRARRSSLRREAANTCLLGEHDWEQNWGELVAVLAACKSSLC